MRALAVAAIGLALMGCSGARSDAEDLSAAVRFADSNVLGCSGQAHTSVPGLRTTNKESLTVGPVTFYPLRSRASAAIAGNYIPKADGRLIPDSIDTFVEPGASVKLIVPRDQRKVYSLWYGKTERGIYSPSTGLRMRVDEGTIAARLDGCSDRRDHRGGFILSRPGCVTLDVYYDGEHHPTTIGFGARCG